MCESVVPRIALAVWAVVVARKPCYFLGSTAIINIIKQVIKILTAGVLVMRLVLLYTEYTTSEGSP